MLERGPIVFRADSSPSMGVGHVARSVTLAKSFARAGHHVYFFSRGSSNLDFLLESEHRLLFKDAVVEPGDVQDARFVLAESPSLVVADGYHFDGLFYQELELNKTPYMVIDDNAETRATKPAALLNQNYRSGHPQYSRFTNQPHFFLGPEYAQIREDFRLARNSGLTRTLDSVLVAIGGSDPVSITFPLVEALASTDYELRVAVGPLATNRGRTLLKLEKFPNVAVIDPSSFARELATCRVALLGAGSSLWEASFMGTQTIAFVVAENQRRVAQEAKRLGFVEAIYQKSDIELSAPHIRSSVRSLLGQSGIDRNLSDVLVGGRDLVSELSEQVFSQGA